MPLTILHAPCHGPSLNMPAIRFACAQGADSIGFTEAYRMIPQLRRRIAYRCRVGKSPVDTRAIASPNGDAGDVPILTRRKYRLLDWDAQSVTPPSEPRKFGPERWLTRVVYDHPFGAVEHINAHPNPRFVDGGGSFNRYLQRLEAMGKRAVRSGHHVIISGDMQSISPAMALFDRIDLDYWRDGIDFIAYSPHLRLRESTPLVDPSQATQERAHPWMLARFAL